VVVELWSFEIAAFWGGFGVSRVGGCLEWVAKTLSVRDCSLSCPGHVLY
jgi:hypothetical protein